MKLIVAANRAPYQIKERKDSVTVEKSSGGLVAALDPIMRDCGGTWICSGNKTFEDYNLETPYKIKQIKLTKNENKHYYEGFCNTQLWPVFHYFPTRYKLHLNDWDYYRQVNQKFANQILDILEPDDKIWIHDYQLMLVPKMLRDKGVTNKIGFFLHIPFPNLEIYKIFPKRKEILEGILGCDLIGVHTESYKKHLLESVSTFFPDLEINDEIINYKERDVKVKSMPISIDFEQIDTMARTDYVNSKTEEIKHYFKSEIIGLGVDRLDYTKGLVEKFEGIEAFLEKHPEYIKKLTFIQIAVPTRTNVPEYINIKREVEETVGRINGKFSRDGWSPISYIYNNVKFNDLISYYRSADFILVSALRDGLNLVAKEYIASKVNDSGMLILSEFTGVAEELAPKSLINPYDSNSVSNAILKTFTASEEEKTKLMSDARDYVKNNNIYVWVDKFLELLE
ncbi:MAG: trehalose-6-phosphate synthase [bacterium]